MTDDQPTAEQARQYADYWAAQAQQLSGAEQQEAQRSAAYWAEQADILELPAPPTPTPPSPPAAASEFAPPAAASTTQLPPPPTTTPVTAAPPVTRAPRGKLLTRGVWITIGIVGFSLIAVIVGGSVLIAQRQAALDEIQGPSASNVVGRYIDALVARDSAVTESLRFREFSTEYGSGARLDELIVGDEAAAESVGLIVDYEFVQEDYSNYLGPVPKMADATSATLVVKLSYTLQAEGRPMTAWGLQSVQLEREEYDARTGEKLDGPRPTSDGPTIAGGWRVSGLGGDFPELDEPMEMGGSDYAAVASTAKYPLCSNPSGIIGQIEDFALANNVLLGECFANNQTNLDAETMEYLATTMVPSDGTNRSDVTGLGEPIIDDVVWKVPFVEYAVTVEERVFVFVIVRVDPTVAAEQDPFDEGDPFAYRIVSIVERTAE